ncbi:MAG: ABC transporter ATP-binding protein [Chlamydiales bacterium]
MKKAVVCQDLKKSYGSGETSVKALRGISFTSEVGELLMLVGPSGCGKTTLLSIISSILDQDSGQCLIFGKNLNAMKNDKRTEYRGKHIGFIFQQFNLIPSLTALENTAIPLIINGENKEQAFALAAELLDCVGLKNRMYAFPREMSGGEQQRVAICRGCIHSPEVIVCDEPTSALDHATGMRVMELFREIALTKESSLIIVTHDSRILHFADKILEMEDGKIISQSTNGLAK